jgi:predicted secreted protein
MVLKKTCLLIAVAHLVCASALWAGDAASFVDLGFSPDGRTYMFAQYGVESGTLRPWADMFAVDVPRNDFVTGGRVSFTHTSPVVAGSDGAGALYRLISRNASLAEKYGVSFLHQGQPLYISLDITGANSRGETIEFRDFEAGNTYKASLIPTVEGSGGSLRSSFHITLDRTTRNGDRANYTVGNPQVKRPLIASYKIKKVMVAPNDGSLIFVIETNKQAADGFDIRYMVEALHQ